METIKCHRVEVPWYLMPFTKVSFQTATVRVAFSVPFVWLVQTVWYAFPKWLYDYQAKDCINYIPDYRAIGSSKDVSGNKVKPFLGFVLRLDRGDLQSWMWWKNIERY